MESKPVKKPRERLASLRDPRGTRRRPTRAPPKVLCPHCQGSNTVEVDNNQVCADCGELITESNIVAEVTFGETSAGAAVVQGGFVGQGERQAKSLGSAFRRAGGVESREVTEAHGRDEIRRIASLVRLPENISDQAFSIYKLAINNNFIQGRRVAVVASACLYIACRREAKNQTLLMDFSEAIRENIFSLGAVYMELKKTLYLNSYAQAGMEPVMDVENLILKYARQLEFGSAVMKVAEDAARVIKRMKRDWMVTGRTPAGICGACLIIAARMNNFRRSVREVVYVVKVTDVTVEKRLDEFARTQCGDLTVEEFRKYGLRLKRQSDPPALYEARVREIKMKRKLEEMQRAESGESQPEEPTPMPRIDRDGFVIPDIPASQANAHQQGDDGETAPAAATRKRGRPRKDDPSELPSKISAADLLVEEELSEEIEKIINDPEVIAAMDDAAFAESLQRAQNLAESLRMRGTSVISDDPEINAQEFENDPEVANCLLSEVESRIKEQIWVTHNEDWLRKKQSQARKKALDETKRPKSTYQRKGRKKRNRLGDGSVLEGGKPVDSPEEANKRMLEKHRPGFSRHINYENLDKLYAEVKRTSSASSDQVTTTASDAGSDAGSVADDSDAGSAVARQHRSRSLFSASPVPLARATRSSRRTAQRQPTLAPKPEAAAGAREAPADAEEEDSASEEASEENEDDQFDRAVQEVQFGFDEDDDISYASGVE